MPTYEYHCDGCGTLFERRQKMSDEPIDICPECGQDRVRKLFSPVASIVRTSAPSCGDRRAPCRGSDASCASGRCPLSGDR